MERTVRELAKMNGRVYVYLANKQIGYKFLSQAEKEGFTFEDGVKPTSPERGFERIMAVNHNGTLNYVGTNGRIAFSGGFRKVGNEKLIRVDYEKYIAGDEYYNFNGKH